MSTQNFGISSKLLTWPPLMACARDNSSMAAARDGMHNQAEMEATGFGQRVSVAAVIIPSVPSAPLM